MDVAFGAAALDDGGFVFGGADPAGLAEVLDGSGVQLAAGFLTDDGAAGEDGNVLEHSLAAVAEAGGFDREDVESAAELVDYQSSQGFAIHILGNDHHILSANLKEFLEGGEQVGNGGNLFVGDDEGGVLDDGFHPVGVGDEVGRDVAAVDLHPFHILDFVGEALGFLDGDDAILADLFHSFGDGFADGFLVGGKAGDLADAVAGFHGLGHTAQFVHYGGNGLLDAALDGHGVAAGGDVLEAFVDEALGQNNGGGGAVAGGVVGLGSGLFEELSAHILEGVGEFNFLGDGNAVAAYQRGAELLVQHHITAFGAEGDLNGLGQSVDAYPEGLAGLFGVSHFLGGHLVILLKISFGYGAPV